MTVNEFGIEIDNKTDSKYRPVISDIIMNSKEIDSVLHVITVISNICEFKRRWKLMNDFINRYSNTKLPIKLYVVELAYGNQTFHVTDVNNKNHLQLRTDYALWHKENMINIAIKKLLPQNWKAVAWIDGDIEFDDPSWATYALKVLNKFDIIQLFQYCADLNSKGEPMNIFQSFCSMYYKGMTHGKGLQYWHPGYAWACTRSAYDKLGGLFDKGILGSGDHHMAMSFVSGESVHGKANIEYKKAFKEYSNKAKGVLLGYIPVSIKHYFHGSKKNRKYVERWDILLKYNYNPSKDIKYDENGIIVPTSSFCKEFLDDILSYFKERNEDED